MRGLCPLFLSVLLILSGCSSSRYVIQADEVDWPTNARLDDIDVVKVSFSTPKRNQVPYIAAIKDPYSTRFLNEADAEITSYTADRRPVFVPGEGLLMAVLYVEEKGSKFAELSRRWAEVFTYHKGVMAQLARGSISIDQVGWSLYTENHDGTWTKTDRAKERSKSLTSVLWSNFWSLFGL